MAKRTIYVVDDEEPIRRSLVLMLSLSGNTVIAFDSGAALLNVAEALSPGCLLLDMRMPDMNGLQVQSRLAEREIGMPIVIMTGHGDQSVAVAALKQGAVAFLEKPFAKAALVEALETAFLKLEHPERYGHYLASAAAKVEALRKDDQALLAGLAAGRSNEKIAANLAISAATMDMRRARLLAELRVESMSEALTMAFAKGVPQWD